jgi:hypothetical protein
MASQQSVELFTMLIQDNDELKAIVKRGKARGGKFALMAKALEGDSEAADLMQELIDKKVIGPGWDFTALDNTN